MSLLERIYSASGLWKAAKQKTAEKEETERQLEQALEQRSRMTVEILNPELAGMDFSGPCLCIEDDLMFIDAPFHEKYAACNGETVEVYFSVERNNATSYFRFASIIRGYDPNNGFALEAPLKLLSNQRREFVRFSPTEADVLHMDVWRLESNDLPPLRSFVTECGDARNRKENVALINLSAAGLRLKVKTSLDDPVGCSDPDSLLLCFLRLKSAGNLQASPFAAITTSLCEALRNSKETLDIWLACAVKHAMEQPDLSHVVLGVNFIAWAAPCLEKKPPTWLNAAEKGEIQLLGNWVRLQELASIAQKRRSINSKP